MDSVRIRDGDERRCEEERAFLWFGDLWYVGELSKRKRDVVIDARVNIQICYYMA